MAPRTWTAYEPVADGRGYKLYDQTGGAQTFAATPAVDALIKALPPRQSLTGATAQAGGAGGGGGAGGAGQDDTQPPAPPPQAADVGYSAPEPVVSTPPPPAPAAAPQPSIPRAPPLASREPQQPGVSLDPNAIPPMAMTPEEADLDAYERARLRQLQNQRAAPAVRIPERWAAEGRVTERRDVDPAALAEYEAAQRAAAESEGTMLEQRAIAEEKARGLEAGKAGKEAEFLARQDAATRKFQEDTLRIEAELEAERKALKNPKDFWASKSENDRATLGVLAALGVLGGALGNNPNAGAEIIQGAIDRHLASKQKNIDALLAKRGRGKEDFDLGQAALQAERAAAIRQIDDQVKAAIAEGQNPILRELMEENVPITPEAVEASLLKGAQSDVAKDAAQKRVLFDFGPNGELVPKESVRYLAAEHAKNMARLQAARERLGLAKELASSQRLSERFQEARVVGGGGGASKEIERILKERALRAKERQEMGFKGAGIVAPIAGQQAKAAAEQAEKEGGRTFVLPTGSGGRQEYVARPGTSEKEMQTLRSVQADIVAMEDALRVIEAEVGPSGKFINNARVEMAAKTFAGVAGSAVLNSGIVNPGELKTVTDTANTIGVVGPNGVKALRDTINTAKARASALASQTGAKPKGAR